MKMLSSILSSPRWVGLLVSLLAFSVYMKTLAPTVTFIDSGELAAVACTLGIAHPTGYPLFTLLGWLFSRLPIAGEEIVRLNVMSAVCSAAGVFIFFHLVSLLLTIAAKPRNASATIIASVGASLVLAFSQTYWSQATSVEVYSLHVFLLSLVLFCFMRANFFQRTEVIAGGGSGRLSESNWWMLFAFTLGLSFTNHMTTILLSLGLLYLYFSGQGVKRESWQRILRMVFPFALGLSVYAYLPVRAASGVMLNWGNPVTVERFLWHLGGKQFRVWLFSSTEAAGKQFRYFVDSLPHEFAYIGLVLALVGLVALLRLHKKLTIGLLVLFLSCVFYSINYDIHDIDSYFLLAYMCIAIWSGFAFLLIVTRAQESRGFTRGVTVLIVVAATLVPIGVHYGVNDESSNHVVEDYTMNMFQSVQPNALVISYQWDFWVSAAYYFQVVKGVRNDIAVVDKELLRRSWYLLQLERRYPWLIRQSQSEVDAFSKELFKFEHDLPYNPGVIQARFVDMISSFVGKSLATRPVYVTAEIEPEFTAGFQRVPEGLALRLFSDTSFHQTPTPNYVIRPLRRGGRLEDMLKNLYLTSLNSRAAYYYKNGLTTETQRIARVADQVAANLGPIQTPP